MLCMGFGASRLESEACLTTDWLCDSHLSLSVSEPQFPHLQSWVMILEKARRENYLK